MTRNELYRQLDARLRKPLRGAMFSFPKVMLTI